MALDLNKTYNIQLSPAGSGRGDTTACVLQARSTNYQGGTTFLNLSFGGVTQNVGYWKTERSYEGSEIDEAYRNALGAAGVSITVDPIIDQIRFNVSAGGGCTQINTNPYEFMIEPE